MFFIYFSLIFLTHFDKLIGEKVRLNAANAIFGQNPTPQIIKNSSHYFFIFKQYYMATLENWLKYIKRVKKILPSYSETIKPFTINYELYGRYLQIKKNYEKLHN